MLRSTSIVKLIVYKTVKCEVVNVGFLQFCNYGLMEMSEIIIFSKGNA